MKTQKIYNDKNLENTINSIIEDSMDFLADDISSILILIELDSKENGIDLAKVIRSNSAISSKLDLVLEEFYTSLSKEIKSIFGLKMTNNKLNKKKSIRQYNICYNSNHTVLELSESIEFIGRRSCG